MPSRYAALVAACAVVTVVAFAAPASAATGCEGADALARARLLTQAQAEYSRLAGEDAPPACAAEGKATAKTDRSRATREVAAAKVFERDHDDAKARDAYARAVGIDVSNADAVAGLEAITSGGTSNICDDAQALRDAHLLEQAAAIYAQIPSSACAKEGASLVETDRKTATADLAAGGRSERAGDVAAASAAYADAFVRDASLEDASAALVDIVTSRGLRPCAQADALRDGKLLEPAQDAYEELQSSSDSPPCADTGQTQVAGDRKAARKILDDGIAHEKAGETSAARDAYAKALAADASLTEARDRLEDVTGTGETLPEKGEELLDVVVSWLGLVAALGILIALLGAVLLRLVTRTVMRWIRWTFDDARRLGDGFPAHAGREVLRFLLIPARWATRIGMQVEDLQAEDKPERAKALTGALQAALPRSGAGGSPSVDAVSAPLSSASAFSEFNDALDKLPQAKIWTALIRTISRLFPRETLKLTGHMLDSKYKLGMTLLLSREDGTALDSVTIWGPEFMPNADPPSDKELGEKEIEESLTVLARAGAAWAGFAYLEYTNILDADEWRRELGTRSWRSFALSRAGARLADDQDSHNLFARARDADVGNPVALFNLASAEFRLDRVEPAWYLAKRVRCDPVPRKPDQILEVDPLRFRVAYLLGAVPLHAHCLPVEPKQGEDWSPKTACARVLADLEPLERAIRRVRRGTVRSTRAGYRFETELVALEEPLLILWAVLDKLSHTNGTVVMSDVRPYTASQVVTNLATDRVLAARTHYNLACYFSLQEDKRRATRHLKRAVHDKRLRAWAPDDPTLEWLQRHKEWWADAMRPLVPPPATPKGLAGILSIGEHAKALRTNDIRNARELLEQTRSPANRLALAKRMTVSPLLVERWARACEVKVLLGIDYEHLNRLDNAMVASVGALSQQGVTRLRALVAAANGGADGLPSAEELGEWIKLANNTQETVLPQL